MNARRLLFGVGASLFDKIVIAGSQLLLVPILATHWGLAVYGAWILLATVPGFLAASDFGFAGAAGTEISMLVARGQRVEAIRIFQSAWVAALASSLGMVALALVVGWSVPNGALPVANGFPAGQSRILLTVMLLYGTAAMQGSLFANGFRGVGLYAVGTLWAALTILIENLAVVVVVVGFQGTPVDAGLALLGARLFALVVQALLLRRGAPWLGLGFSEARWNSVRALVRPALAIVLIPLSQALFLQGSVWALGIAAGAAAVPAFTAARTLSRTGLQVTQLFSNALIPEYSVAVARDDRPSQATMLVLTLLASALVLVPFALLLVFWGPYVMRLWTHGVITADRALMLVMAVTVVLGGTWNSLSNLVIAMNRHATFTYPFVALALLTVPLCYLMSCWLGATGAALASAALDAGMCIVLLRLGRALFVSPVEIRMAISGAWGTAMTMMKNRRSA